MSLRLVPVEEQKEIIPDCAIRVAFMAREDIAPLDDLEKERLWKEQLVKVNELREILSRIPSVVIE